MKMCLEICDFVAEKSVSGIAFPGGMFRKAGWFTYTQSDLNRQSPSKSDCVYVNRPNTG